MPLVAQAQALGSALAPAKGSVVVSMKWGENWLRRYCHHHTP